MGYKAGTFVSLINTDVKLWDAHNIQEMIYCSAILYCERVQTQI